jgi:hypothetical protein
MRGFVTTCLLATLFFRSGLALADGRTCPIDRVAAIVRGVAGDASAARIVGEGAPQPASVGVCIVYDERLEVGPEAIVTLETAKGERHIGGPYEPAFTVAEPSKGRSSEASSYLASLFSELFSHSGQTLAATGRGAWKCGAAGQTDEKLAPLERLRAPHQEIGADLGLIVAAWKPAARPRAVRVALLDAGGLPIAAAQTCSSAHVFLRPRPGRLHLGDQVILEISDEHDKLDYDLLVVDPKDLPLPPVPLPSLWLNAAWRLAAGPTNVQLDSLARLQTAPPDALAARVLTEAVWSDSKF